VNCDAEKLLTRILIHVNHVLETSGRAPLSCLKLSDRLGQDLQLDSLELAELTVLIESEFGVDVFARGIITTVGEIVERLKGH
jgi:acyl carrier protein